MSDEEVSGGNKKVIFIALGCLLMPLLFGLVTAPVSIFAIPLFSAVAAIIIVRSRPLILGKRIALGILLFFCFVLASGFLAFMGCTATGFRGIDLH